ncbi:uncharacterized protein LOC129581142 [Paramacrobiotus metropolitanus]|uniref:uncharacterized protein LOC129581142 n=1 Tax=Paramacrobiotus metropolitanus TaxID=2943436 RepID=UPI002445E0EE|nr:uncharacterized protein LOC129581142 [Paramacrobiotus metropolitanus]
MATKREKIPLTPLQIDQQLIERVKRLEPDKDIIAREFHDRPPLPRERAITRKPMSDHDYVDDIDPPERLLALLREQLKAPYERLELPLTTAQEIGFYATTNLVNTDGRDEQLNFPRNGTEITIIPDLYAKDKTRTSSKKP